VSPPVDQRQLSVPVIDTWIPEEHDERMTVKKMLMSKNSNKSAEEHVKELLEFIKTVPPRPLVFTNDEDALYFYHQAHAPNALPTVSRAARDRRAQRMRRAGVTAQSLPRSELVSSEYRYSVPNRLLKFTAQQVLLQQTVKIALLSGLLHQNDSATSNKQLRSSKGRARANNSTTLTPPPSATVIPSTSDKSTLPTEKSASESEVVDEKSLLAKLLQLEPSAAGKNSSSSTGVTTSTAPPTAINSNNVTAVSTPVPVTSAPNTSIAVPATPVTSASTSKAGHVPTALLVPNSALSATLMKDISFKGKTGSGVPLTAVTLLHPTQLQGANVSDIRQ